MIALQLVLRNATRFVADRKQATKGEIQMYQNMARNLARFLLSLRAQVPVSAAIAAFPPR